MTIRFAAARGGNHPAIAQALCPSAPMGPANDNARIVTPTPANDVSLAEGQVLTAALRHFAQHGMAAAEHARANAEAARRDGDQESLEWWIGICRQLDRRMADGISRRLTGKR